MTIAAKRLVVPMSRWVALGAAITLVATLGIWRDVPWASAITSSGDRAIFEPLTPARILDTRAPSNPIGAGESRLLQVTGAGGVAADATAVLLNITAVSPTRAGFLTLYPADGTRPTASNVNFVAGQVVPNSATVKLSTGANPGRILIYNSAGQTNVLVDVAGYYRGHDHNDLYYTKAQAQARTAANALTCPGGSFLNTVAADGTPTCGVGAQGPAGPAGPPGPAGPAGPAGSPDTAAQILNKLVTVDGASSGLDADLLDGLSSNNFAHKIASSTLFIGYSAEAYDDPGECVSQFFTNIGGLQLGDQVVASITRNGSELSPPNGLLGTAWIVERLEGDVEVPRILVRFCNVTPGVIESVGLNIRATVYR